MKQIVEAPTYPQQDRMAGLKVEHQGSRRVTEYDPILALEMVELIAQGNTLSAICHPWVRDEDGKDTDERSRFPSRQTFYRWLVNQPELARAYATAREVSASSLEEEALDLGREIVRNPGTAQRVRAFEVLMNQLRWSASKRNPRVFSERGAVQITVPIQINTSLPLGGDGQPSHSGQIGPVSGDPNSIYQIEAKVEVPPAEGDEPPTNEELMVSGKEPLYKGKQGVKNNGKGLRKSKKETKGGKV